jgi:hypothetical protein
MSTSLDSLTARVAALELLCAELYQFAGEVGAPVRVLDALIAAAEGDPIPEATILPLRAEECTAVAELQARLDRVRQAVA